MRPLSLIKREFAATPEAIFSASPSVSAPYPVAIRYLSDGSEPARAAGGFLDAFGTVIAQSL